MSRSPRTSASAGGVHAPAAKVLKRVRCFIPGMVQQAPAKRQYRGSRNSTGDGF
ncbi:single-stranded DNA-binding protein [Enterobacter huaxiensis]|uniref:Single-stranded DNA-binding protein n=1 Tax=Enterobacter huaxiensis TaxID=2494702 RepID=A0A3R9NQK6_9ENTR|nr:single-stranded DNA-binding protein [Enterobacter huaxiensis]